MKVRELIEKLKTFDPETLVVTSGMDQVDYEELRIVKSIEIGKNPEGSTSFGEYGNRHPTSEPRFKAILVDYC